jgi:hypothetical protein
MKVGNMRVGEIVWVWFHQFSIFNDEVLIKVDCETLSAHEEGTARITRREDDVTVPKRYEDSIRSHLQVVMGAEIKSTEGCLFVRFL